MSAILAALHGVIDLFLAFLPYLAALAVAFISLCPGALRWVADKDEAAAKWRSALLRSHASAFECAVGAYKAAFRKQQEGVNA